jgi:WD40 repeat protein
VLRKIGPGEPRSVVLLGVYGVVVAVTWVLGVTVSGAVGVLCALVAAPGLAMVVSLRWRQGRTTRTGFTAIVVAAPVLVGFLTNLDALGDWEVTSGPVLGLGVGLVAAAVSVLVVRTELFRTKPDVFICYRRVDSVYAVDRIYERLVRRYGGNHVFRDTDTVRPGQHVQDRISRDIRECDTVLAVIGPDWTTVRHRNGTPRLHMPHDYVRFELEQAFEAGLTVIPVLVDGATLPDKDDLPASLRRLPDLDAIAVRPATDFTNDLRSLTDRVELARRRLTWGREPWRAARRRNAAAVALAFALVSQLAVITLATNAVSDTRTYLSPDGTHLLSTHGGAFGTPTTLWLWDTADGRLVGTVPYPGLDLREVRWSPDSRRFATGDAVGRIQIWNGADLAPGTELRGLSGYTGDGFTWSPDSEEFAVVDDSGLLRVWRVPTTGPAREIASEKATSGNLGVRLSWSARGDLIAVSGLSRELSVWHQLPDRLERRFDDLPTDTVDAQWSPDGTRLAVSTYRDPGVLVLGPDGKPVPGLALDGEPWGVEHLYWSPDSSLLAATTVSGQGTAWMWDAATGELHQSATLAGPAGYVSSDLSLAWSPDNAQAVVGTGGRFLVLSVDGDRQALHSPDRAGVVARWAADGIQVVSAERYRTRVRVSWTNTTGTWHTTTFEVTPWRVATSIDLTTDPPL